MDPFGSSFSLQASVRPVKVEVYTPAFRVLGVTSTRFARVADVMNQVSTTHLSVGDATLTEYGDKAGKAERRRVLVPVEQILFVVTPELEGAARADMQVNRRAVPVTLAAAPFVVTGELHVPSGVGSVEGLLNSPDRFVTMTGVQISCRSHPELNQAVAAIAVQRTLPILAISEDAQRTGSELADVLDAETAAGWLRKPDGGPRSG
jgi:hypothetical protein